MEHDGNEGTDNVTPEGAEAPPRYYMDPWRKVVSYRSDEPEPRDVSARVRDRYSATAWPASVTHHVTNMSFGVAADAARTNNAGLRCVAVLRRAQELAQLCRELLQSKFGLSAEPMLTSRAARRGGISSVGVSWAVSPVGGITAITYERVGTCGKCPACVADAKAAEASPESWVYFIQATTGGPVKIGYSAKPYARLATLRSGSAGDLRVAALTPGGVEEERMLHRLFARHRIRPRGEWFHPAPAILALIDELAEVTPP